MFNPDQLRAPAGTPIGGQWIDMGLAKETVGSWTGKYKELREEGEGWVDDPSTSARWSHVHAWNQSGMEKLGIKGPQRLYRGIYFDQQSELIDALRSGQLKVGDEIELTEEGIKFNSWSESNDVARQYALGQDSPDPVPGVVFEAETDTRDIVWHYRVTGTGTGKREVVVMSRKPRRVRIVDFIDTEEAA